MHVSTSVTQKGQVTLPKKIRDKFGLKTYDRVRVEDRGDHIAVIPTKDVVDLAGAFKSKKSVLNAREKFEEDYSRT